MFLDRDGVINKKIEGGYVRNWSEFEFLPNIIDWIRLFRALDHLVIVVTNQRGVALGRMTLADLNQIHDKMLEALEMQGAFIDDIFVCPHEANSCECRKPKPGLVLQAQEMYDIDLAASLIIGDSDSDEQLARNCGLRFLRAENGRLTAGPL